MNAIESCPVSAKTDPRLQKPNEPRLRRTDGYVFVSRVELVSTCHECRGVIVGGVATASGANDEERRTKYSSVVCVIRADFSIR